MGFLYPFKIFAQKQIVNKDSVVYNIIHRDTIIYRYDTVRVNHYIHSDTVWTNAPQPAVRSDSRRKMLDVNSWGIGPSIGAYYSPFNGFDVNIGFGIQYYFFSIPSFRNPHSGHRRNRK